MKTGYSYTLGKEERLKSRKLIERVFKEGKSFALYPFRVYYTSLPVPGDEAHSGLAAASPESVSLPDLGPGTRKPCLQAGFGASSRNFKKAVDRNRIKRLSREAYRLQKQDLNEQLIRKGQSLALFFIYTGKELPDYALVREKIGQALQKLMKNNGL